MSNSPGEEATTARTIASAASAASMSMWCTVSVLSCKLPSTGATVWKALLERSLAKVATLAWQTGVLTVPHAESHVVITGCK